MKLSEEMAVRLHRMMWSDMQKKLGDNPEGELRHSFKVGWIKKYFPGEYIENQCFLCEYVKQFTGHSVAIGCDGCSACPIKWPKDACCDFGLTIAPVHFLNSPIHDILELATRHADPDILWNYEQEALEKANGYRKFREEKLSEYSGLPGSAAIEDHVKAIVKKAREEGYETAKEYLAECSGLNQDEVIFDHIKAIKEKAVEEYFANTPGAKLATMDVDDAFKQYAKEQTEPIFKLLSEASGLAENNHAVMDHICWIKNKARQEGRNEKKGQLKDLLAKESGLDCNRSIDDHIREIVKNSMEAGAAEERDRIQEKIYEVLLS